MTLDPDLRRRALTWIDHDPDPDDARELRALLDAADAGSADAAAELADRCSAPLGFGTAGLRGAMGAGPARMNLAVVTRTAAGIASWLADGEIEGCVVVGYDARRRSAAFAEAGVVPSVPGGAVVGYLGILLVLCKTLGAILYSALALPLVLLTKPRTWVRVSLVIALILCAYPMLRNYDIIPVRRVVTQISSFNAERAGSFQFRVENEDRLLAKANQKPAFGWGTWGRNRVFKEDSGEDLTITDGAWILRYGMFGWFGYLGLFGLFAAAIFNARAGVKGPVTPPKIVLGALTLMLAINLIDLVPNANLLPLTFLLAGTIAGRPRLAVAKVRRSATPEPALPLQALAHAQ